MEEKVGFRSCPDDVAIAVSSITEYRASNVSAVTVFVLSIVTTRTHSVVGTC